ncbi:hypothetical protein GCM10009110_12630 [Psychrobacter piscatorii]
MNYKRAMHSVKSSLLLLNKRRSPVFFEIIGSFTYFIKLYKNGVSDNTTGLLSNVVCCRIVRDTLINEVITKDVI